jgi:hypothetical protein
MVNITKDEIGENQAGIKPKNTLTIETRRTEETGVLPFIKELPRNTARAVKAAGDVFFNMDVDMDSGLSAPDPSASVRYDVDLQTGKERFSTETVRTSKDYSTLSSEDGKVEYYGKVGGKWQHVELKGIKPDEIKQMVLGIQRDATVDPSEEAAVLRVHAHAKIEAEARVKGRQ